LLRYPFRLEFVVIMRVAYRKSSARAADDLVEPRFGGRKRLPGSAPQHVGGL
jgi:hypothetical protein